MKEINSLKSLQETLKANGTIWLLLYKKGAPQSDCAFKNLGEIAKQVDESFLYSADVNSVKDIHPKFGIDTVPTLMKFENSGLKKVIKGCHRAEQLKAAIEGTTFAASGKNNKQVQKNVIVYTSPTCSWCTAVKRHFDAHGIVYREVNVASDTKAAKEMVKKSGQQGVPQTEIDGQIVVGFDKTRINSLLGIN